MRQHDMQTLPQLDLRNSPHPRWHMGCMEVSGDWQGVWKFDGLAEWREPAEDVRKEIEVKEAMNA